MMKIIKILLVLTVLFISISAVSAEGNFTALQNEINSSGDSIDIKNDYVYDNATDYSYNEGISVKAILPLTVTATQLMEPIKPEFLKSMEKTLRF